MSHNFKEDEMACQGKNCCDHSCPIDQRLYDGLEELRAIVQVELNNSKIGLSVSSGYRCKKHNATIKNAAANSKHTLGIAADVYAPKGITPRRFALLAQRVKVFREGGVGLYSNRIHVDVRGEIARWGF